MPRAVVVVVVVMTDFVVGTNAAPRPTTTALEKTDNNKDSFIMYFASKRCDVL
jgi:hypothetical protein